MEEDKNLDQLFRQAIEPFQMDPPEHVWNSLDEKLNARRVPGRDKKNRRLWFSSIAALFLLFAGSYLYFSGYFSSPDSGPGNTPSAPLSSTPASPGNNSVTQSSPSPAGAGSRAAKDHGAEQAGSAAQESDPNAEVASGSGQAAVAPAASNRSSRESSSPAVAGTSTKKKSSQGTQASSGAMETSSGNRNSSSVGRNRKEVAAGVAVTAPSGHAQPSSGEKAAEKSLKDSGGEQGTSKQDAAAVAGATELNAKTPDGSDANTVQAESEAGSPAQTETQGTVPSETQVQATAEPESVASGIAAGAADTSADYNQDKNSGSWLKRFVNRLSVDLFYSPDLAQRKLSVNDSYTGPGASEGNTYYNKAERPGYSYSTGVRFKEEISSRWSITTGCFFSTFSQSSDLNNVYVISDSSFQHNFGSHPQGSHAVPGPNHSHGPGNGPTGPRPGTYNQHYVVHTSSGTIDLQNQPFPHQGPGEHNIPWAGDTLNLNIQSSELIQFISIPLTVRYQVTRQHWAFYGEAGAAINFVYDNSVTINVDNSYTETNDLMGLKNTSYSMLLSVGALYKVQPLWGLFAEPTLRYSITPINESSPMLSYPYFLGLKMGLSYQF